jgi:dimethylglycine dehydrogenase
MTSAHPVAIIGGGIVGVSTAYHLALAGCTDVLLLERSELTAGSTWHAAGNLPHFHGSFNLMRLQAYGKQLYRGLQAQSTQPLGLHWTGALRLAHSAARVDEFERVAGMARACGLAMRLIGIDEARRLHPHLVPDGLAGVLWDPVDGHADPTSLTQAMAAHARERGVVIKRHTPVLGITRGASGQWKLETPGGAFEAEKIVIAAGFRSPEVAALLGLRIPLANMEHQYLVTDSVPELTAQAGELPMVRDPDDSYYLRQEGKGFVLGPYEHCGKPWAVEGVPPHFGQELLAPDLDRIEDIVAQAMQRVPISANAGIKTIVNGPITYTPDGNPLIGPVAGVDNLFLNTGSGFGIVQGGGSGKACAEWVLRGHTEWDLWELDPRRFDMTVMTPQHVVDKCVELYNHEYAAGTPYEYEMRPAARGLKTSAATARHEAAGAVFFSRFGWERPAWFAPAGAEPSARHEQHSFRRSNWWSAVRAECHAVRDHAGLLDLTPFSKWSLRGAGAQAVLDALGANRAPRVTGAITLTHALTAEGGVISEFTVTRLADDHFYVVSAAAANLHDGDLLRRALPADGSATLQDLTRERGTLVLAGPRARDVLAALTDADLSSAAFPWLSAREITVAGVALLALRVNFVGELGWELHHPIEQQGELHDALMQAGAAHGLRPFGLRAMDSLRIEKMYRNWRSDLTTEASLLEAGMQRFARLDDERAFNGKAALLAQTRNGLTRQMVLLRVDAPDVAADHGADPGADHGADALGAEPVLAGERIVGLTSSGAYGHRVEASLALAYVEAAYAAAGTSLAIDLLGRRRAATVLPAPPYDPNNQRLRS